jgi:phage terminase large subunit
MKNRNITTKQIELARRGLIDPVLFARRFLGVRLWERQAEVLQSIRTHRKTVVKACHATGKTFVLAVAVLWWLARYRDGIVITTSSTFRQVKTQIWSELHRLVTNARVPYPEFNKTELKLRGDDNFALGLSTNQAENFQGYHGKHVLIVADEALGIEAEIWDAMAGIAAGGDVHMVMAGNPTTPSGPFYDAFHRERSSWNCISIDAFESPNLEGISLEQLLQIDPVERGPLDQNPFSYLVTKRWVFEQYFAWWHGDEQSSPVWMSRVRGQFPDQAEDALIKLRWLERAKERALRDPVEDSGRRLIAGVDVGGGQAETVVVFFENQRDTPTG